MKASFVQKCSFALLLALVPFLQGCGPGQAMSAPVTQAEEVPTAQPPDAPPAGDAATSDTNALSAADISAATNADAALENADGKLLSTPDTASTNATTNPQLTGFVKLVQAGVGESVLLAYVTNSPSAFNVSSDDILYLNDLGTPDSVITAMLQKDQQYGTGGVAAPATPPVQPSNDSLVAGGAAQLTAPPVSANPEVQTPPLTPSGDVEAEVAQSPNGSYSYFYDSLAPYGNWVNLDGYGPCWQPTVVVVNPGWTPYCDRGHWAYTDCGWCWVSDYSWGWAPFHYGRWFHHAHYGWCWAPDTVWGPAWVSWRYSDAYCGWAPLPPSACYRPGFGFTYYGHSVGASFAFGLGVGHFTFVAMDHFHDRYPAHYRVEHREVTKIYNTTVINNTIIRGNNHNLINRGVPVDRVAAATHQDIRPIRVRAESDGPRNAQLGRDGRSLAVYRPELPAPKPGRAPRLVGEGVKPAPEFNLHSRVEQGQGRAVATRTTANESSAPNTREDRRPIVGNPNVNRPDNVVRDNRDNRANQPNAERPGSLIMRGANQPDRQTPVGNQNPAQNAPAELRHGPQFSPNSTVQPVQPDRGDNRRTVTPPMTPGGQPYRGQTDGTRQNPSQDFNQRNVTRPEIDQQQGQQRQLLQQQRDLQQQQQQQQRDIQQQQQRDLQQQQRQLQQQQRDIQQQQQQQLRQQREIQTAPLVPRQEVPNRSYDGTPRMQENRPAPEMRSAPQYTAPAVRSDGGGGGRSSDNGASRGNSGGGGNNGGGNGNNNGNGNGNGNGRNR